LAGRTSKHDVHALTTYSCPTPDLVSGQTGNRLRQYGALRKVVFVNGTMDGVDFDGGHNVETGLFEAQS
jgi:hypothetical protein